MPNITLINPNTSQATTTMMVEIAGKYAPNGCIIEGVTARNGVPMIVDHAQLEASTQGVIEMGLARVGKTDGFIVSAFGDSGLEQLKEKTGTPVIGICEASMLEAALGGRRFGIATVTPNLVDSFAKKADLLGLAPLFTGTRLTSGDALALMSDPERLLAALSIAVLECLEKDHAEAVIIGGGPLGQAAEELQRQFDAPVIAPIRSAVEQLFFRMQKHKAEECNAR